jgi:hypothetical protein
LCSHSPVISGDCKISIPSASKPTLITADAAYRVTVASARIYY